MILNIFPLFYFKTRIFSVPFPDEFIMSNLHLVIFQNKSSLCIRSWEGNLHYELIKGYSVLVLQNFFELLVFTIFLNLLQSDGFVTPCTLVYDIKGQDQSVISYEEGEFCCHSVSLTYFRGFLSS